MPKNAYNDFDNDKNLIRGANANFKVFKDLSKFCKVERYQEKEILNFFMIPPSFTCIVKTKYPEYMKDAVKNLNKLDSIKTEELGH